MDAQLLSDPMTGRGTLVTEDGQLWTLNVTATTALTVLLAGGTQADAEEALARRWPHVPLRRLSAELTTCLTPLRDAGVLP